LLIERKGGLFGVSLKFKEERERNSGDLCQVIQVIFSKDLQGRQNIIEDEERSSHIFFILFHSKNMPKTTSGSLC